MKNLKVNCESEINGIKTPWAVEKVFLRLNSEGLRQEVSKLGITAFLGNYGLNAGGGCIKVFGLGQRVYSCSDSITDADGYDCGTNIGLFLNLAGLKVADIDGVEEFGNYSVIEVCKQLDYNFSDDENINFSNPAIIRVPDTENECIELLTNLALNGYNDSIEHFDIMRVKFKSFFAIDVVGEQKTENGKVTVITTPRLNTCHFPGDNRVHATEYDNIEAFAKHAKYFAMINNDRNTSKIKK